MADVTGGLGDRSVTRKIILAVTSASPKLQGINQTISALSRLTTQLRSVNRELGMLRATSGLRFGEVIGAGMESAAARTEKAVGRMVAASKQATNVIGRTTSYNPSGGVTSVATTRAIGPGTRETTYLRRGEGGGLEMTGSKIVESPGILRKAAKTAEEMAYTRWLATQASRQLGAGRTLPIYPHSPFRELMGLGAGRSPASAEVDRLISDFRRDMAADLKRYRASRSQSRGAPAAKDPMAQLMGFGVGGAPSAQEWGEHQQFAKAQRQENTKRFNEARRAWQQQGGIFGGPGGESGGPARPQTNRARWLDRGIKGWTPEGFAKNVLTVGGWMTAVNAYFGAMRLTGYSYQRAEALEKQTARLEQVFRSVGGSAQDLTDDVLKLAAAEGRSSDEAAEAAISWSRLGLSRKQVAEATRVSLMAANVAEMSAGDTTQALAAIMKGFNLQVYELNSALGMLNQTSNTYRVTVAEMLQGISRVAGVAQQAGLSLAELQGILGATVQKTGQTGAQIANALKTALVQLNRPDVREFFAKRYGFEPSGSAQDLQRLYWLFQKGNNEQQRDILLKVGRATQANRVRSIMESYDESIIAAAESLRNLNSAEIENIKITNTAASARARLVTSWDRFVNYPSVTQWGAGIMNNASGSLAGITNFQNWIAGGTGGNRPARYFNPSKASIWGTALSIPKAIASGSILTPYGLLGSIGGERNPLGQYMRWVSGGVDYLQGYRNTPQTIDQKFDFASREIETIGGQARASGIIGRYLMGASKNFNQLPSDRREDRLRTFKSLGVSDAALRALADGNTEQLRAEADKFLAKERELLDRRRKRIELNIDELEIEKRRTKNTGDIEAIEAQIQERKEAIRMAAEQANDIEDDREASQWSIVRALTVQRELTRGISESLKGIGLDEYYSRVVGITSEIRALEQMIAGEPNMRARERLDEMLQEKEIERRALTGNTMSMMAAFNRGIGIASQMTGFDVAGSAVGESQGEKLLAQRKYIMDEIVRLERDSARSIDDDVRLATLKNQLVSTELSIQQRITENLREQKQLTIDTLREFQRSLVGAGPAELLKKLAAFQLNRRGLTGGEFWALSPDIRRDVYALRGGPQRAELGAEAAAMRGRAMSVGAMQGFAAQQAADAAKIGASMLEKFSAASSAASAVAGYMRMAEGAARGIAAIFGQLTSGSAARSSAPSAAPVSQSPTGMVGWGYEPTDPGMFGPEVAANYPICHTYTSPTTGRFRRAPSNTTDFPYTLDEGHPGGNRPAPTGGPLPGMSPSAL